MRIMTWNINSLRLRLPQLEMICNQWNPDIVCLQEIKVANELFPEAGVKALGFPYLVYHGIKGYNGTAILSKHPFQDSGKLNWCGKSDARHTMIRLKGDIEIHNFYVPAGGDIPDPEENQKFAHKLEFLDEVSSWSDSLDENNKYIIVGDLNIAPFENDVWSTKQLRKVVSHTDVERKKLLDLIEKNNWIDSPRHFVPTNDKLFSWWSYRSKDWQASNRGRRLDHILISENLRENLKNSFVFHDSRGWIQPSDHIPVFVDIE